LGEGTGEGTGAAGGDSGCGVPVDRGTEVRENTSLVRAMNARAGTADSSQPEGLGLATASWADSDRQMPATSRQIG
jgi:hypothetical protein